MDIEPSGLDCECSWNLVVTSPADPSIRARCRYYRFVGGTDANVARQLYDATASLVSLGKDAVTWLRPRHDATVHWRTRTTGSAERFVSDVVEDFRSGADDRQDLPASLLQAIEASVRKILADKPATDRVRVHVELRQGPELSWTSPEGPGEHAFEQSLEITAHAPPDRIARQIRTEARWQVLRLADPVPRNLAASLQWQLALAPQGLLTVLHPPVMQLGAGPRYEVKCMDEWQAEGGAAALTQRIFDAARMMARDGADALARRMPNPAALRWRVFARCQGMEPAVRGRRTDGQVGDPTCGVEPGAAIPEILRSLAQAIDRLPEDQARAADRFHADLEVVVTPHGLADRRDSGRHVRRTCHFLYESDGPWERARQVILDQAQADLAGWRPSRHLRPALTGCTSPSES